MILDNHKFLAAPSFNYFTWRFPWHYVTLMNINFETEVSVLGSQLNFFVKKKRRRFIIINIFALVHKATRNIDTSLLQYTFATN